LALALKRWRQETLQKEEKRDGRMAELSVVRHPVPQDPLYRIGLCALQANKAATPAPVKDEEDEVKHLAQPNLLKPVTLIQSQMTLNLTGGGPRNNLIAPFETSVLGGLSPDFEGRYLGETEPEQEAPRPVAHP